MHACLDTEQMVAYCLRQLTPEEEISLKTHVPLCAACRLKLAEVAETVELLPLSVPLATVSPPPSLRDRIVTAAAAQGRPGDHVSPGVRTRLRLPLSIAVAAACTAIAVGGYSLWRVQRLQGQLAQLATPAIRERAVQMAGTDAAPTSGGRVAVLEESAGSRVVLNVQGLPSLQPGEVYQLWLIKDGKRKSGGVFVVDAAGSGSVALWTNEPVNFDALGITREPDANGQQPRGTKVMGSI